MGNADVNESSTLETEYPTTLSDSFEAQGGSEYHIVRAIAEIKEKLVGLDNETGNTALQDQMDWIVTQLGNLAYTAGVEASNGDIEEIVNQRIEDRDYSYAIERKIRGF